VSQESFGESIQRNLSWAGRDRALPPEMIPHKLFDRIFGARDEGWVKRKRSVLDAVREDAVSLKSELGKQDQLRVEDHLASIRDVERAISTLPPEYSKVEEPEIGGDMKDWPRIAKLQTDLLVHALATGQTRVASYMLTKCQGLSRFPWLGYTAAATTITSPGRQSASRHSDGQRIMRDICRWHVEEFAYLIAKLKSIPEGDGTLLDHCRRSTFTSTLKLTITRTMAFAIVAGHVRSWLMERIQETGSMGDLYQTLANRVMGTAIRTSPPAATSYWRRRLVRCYHKPASQEHDCALSFRAEVS
jgi:hypothetical protein